MLALLLTLATSVLPSPSSDVKPGAIPSATPQQVRSAIERGASFLDTEAVKWREKSKCTTCHHGALTAMALTEVKSKGFSVREDAIQEMIAWSKQKYDPAVEELPNLTNGFEIPSLGIPILAMTLDTKSDALTPDETGRMAKYIMDRQMSDGGWPIQQRNPHPVMESREIMTLWFYLALDADLRAAPSHAESTKASREKALQFLADTPQADTTQASALRLLVSLRTGKERAKLKGRLDELKQRQNSDGGWSQTKELASDAYATGQALYVLSVAGTKRDSKEVRRGVDFLVATQAADASWPMISRESGERKAAKNLLPIIYFGTSWATMGLARSMPDAGVR